MKRSAMMLSVIAMVLGLFGGMAQAGDNIATVSGNWEDGGTWSVGVPQASEDIIIPAGITVTMNGLTTRSINSLTITGVLTHAVNANTEANKIVLNVTSDVTVEAGGAIDVNGKGYGWLNNTGYGPGGTTGRAGAGYGGEGSDWAADGKLGGPTYGSVTTPVNLGSGCGGRSGNAYGSGGGGAVLLQVGGTLTVNATGAIAANGNSYNDQSAGSGGTISISANAFGGAGTISAEGGTCNSSRGAAGGGRVALVAGSGTTAQFDALTINARGGDGAANSDGGAGTIYLKAPTQTYGSLVVKNRDARSAALTTWTNATYRFDSIETLNYGTLVPGVGSVLDLTGTTLTSDSTSVSITSRIIVDSGNPGRYVFPSSFTNTSCLSQSGTNPLTFLGDLVIASGGVLTHEANADTEVNKLILNVSSNLTVASGGAISVFSRGYGFLGTVGYGPGGVRGRAGAGHGGEGSDFDSRLGGQTYGSVINPVSLGSGCAGLSVAANGSGGGGVVMLQVGGTLTVNATGTIAANGGFYSDSSSAAGGSVNIRANVFAGSGSITAIGGTANSNRGASGGGRIALRAGSGTTTQFDTLTINAQGGDGTPDGAAGTVYLQSGSQGEGEGTVYVDNAGLNINAYTHLPPAISPVAGELLKVSLVVTNKGGVLLTATETWGGDLSIADAGSQLDLAGFTLTAGTFQDFDSAQVTSGTHTDNTTAPYIGSFDGVIFNGGTLIVQILPPDINTLAPNGISNDSASMIGNVLGTGGRSDVELRVFYGTTDGTDAPGSWYTNELVDAAAVIGVYTQVVSGTLTTDSEYYYRFRGTDNSKTNWGEPSAYFITGDITITATDSTAQEGVDTGTFTISRPAGLDSEDLTVNFTISGSAGNGTDYDSIASNVVLAAGAISTNIIITPIVDGTEGSETVTLTLAVGHYPATASSDTITISDAPVTITWTGAGDGVNASDTTNWDLGRVPLSTDTIGLDGVAANGNANLTWDYNGGGNGVPASVAVWNQDGYTGTVTFPTTYGGSFPTFTITANAFVNSGAWTHPANGATEVSRLGVTVNGNLSIGAGGVIDVDGKGYGWLNSTGYGPGFSIGRSGAAHGGQGAQGASGTPSLVTYGSVTNPVSLGSGSGGQNGISGSAGGGAITLQVGGTLTVAEGGLISAEGDFISDQSAAAGGSVNISANAFEGSGTISAKGGAAGSNGGGAGGGRIALVAGSGDSSQYDTLTLTAAGGSGTYLRAAAGTIYLRVPGQTYGALLVKNHGAVVAPVTSWRNETNRFDSIITTNAGTLAIGTNGVLDLTGTTLASDSTSDSITSRIVFGPETNRVIFPATFTLGGTLSQSGTNLYPVTGNVVIAAGGVLTHENNGAATTNENDRLNLDIAGNLTVQVGGAISVKGKGYGYNASSTTIAYGPGGSPGRSGGTHGGQGGDGADYIASDITYGSIINPVNYGSGSAGRMAGQGSNGGGSILLDISGTTTINGTVDADGTSISDYSAGAGGSINISANAFAGAGTIRAEGADDTGNGGGGGGGRVALVAASGGFGSLTITAYGGNGGGQQEGAAGTVYLQTGSQGAGEGTVYVDNAGQNIDAYTGVPPHTDAVADELANASVVVTNQGAVVSTANVSLGDLLIHTDSYWLLDTWTVYVDCEEHSLEDVSIPGPGATTRVDHYDQVIWYVPPAGSLFMFK